MKFRFSLSALLVLTAIATPISRTSVAETAPVVSAPSSAPPAITSSPTPTKGPTPTPAAAVKSISPTPPPAVSEDDDEKEDTSSGDQLGAETVLPPQTEEDLKTEMSQARPWMPPNYSGQESSLGYGPQAFEIPKGLEDRVKFWIQIYTKYPSNQGVLHDRTWVHLVYEPVDFSTLPIRDSMSPRQKQKAREKYVKERKKEIKAQLLRLASFKSEEGLTGDDLRVWKMFESIKDPNKFKVAASPDRIRFQLGQADIFKKGIFHSGRYIRLMENIFREEKIPVEITRLPFVESSFNIFARSRVGASGVWQFMRSTARLYHMKMNGILDERTDPLRATRAAAKKMRENYNLLGNWPLAVTAYNQGPGGIKKIAKKLGTPDLAEIVAKAHAAQARHRFGFAGENFYSCFLAALEVEGHARQYFTDAWWGKELKFEENPTPKNIRYGMLTQAFNGDSELVELFNPHFTSYIRKGSRVIPKGTLIRLPPEAKKKFDAGITIAPTLSDPKLSSHQVARGETLGAIAREYGISLQSLMDANDSIKANRLKPGMTIQIPLKAEAARGKKAE